MLETQQQQQRGGKPAQQFWIGEWRDCFFFFFCNVVQTISKPLHKPSGAQSSVMVGLHTKRPIELLCFIYLFITFTGAHFIYPCPLWMSFQSQAKLRHLTKHLRASWLFCDIPVATMLFFLCFKNTALWCIFFFAASVFLFETYFEAWSTHHTQKFMQKNICEKSVCLQFHSSQLLFSIT